MRIIGGALGGRKFQPPARMPARPTTDVAKEGLFNTLQNRINFEGLKTLDLFGGTGSISYELASRGATDLTIVERDRNLSGFIRRHAEEFALHNLKVIQADVFKFLSSCREQYDFIFAGPPYALTEIDMIPKIIAERELLKPEGLFVLEHTPRNNYEQYPGFTLKKAYGTTLFSFFNSIRLKKHP